GKGPHTVQTGPTGAPQQGGVVPYQQVVGQYSQALHAAFDTTPLPPGMRAYARSYFAAIAR
ncbi:MAG: hypothetical protein JOZ41_16445, partial [Chloroflexi bacterium]|nr:hypothetical protein [Chloroflexota bacterium]